MATIRRVTHGPQDWHEQSGAAFYRDTRSIGSQVKALLGSGASAVGLVGIGALTFAIPAITPMTVPIALAYAAYVLTRPVTLPLRKPVGGGREDMGNPVPDPKRPGREIAGPCTGDVPIGWCESTGQQLWLSSREDLTMHGLLPGSTGSGKTELIYSLLYSTVAQGNGFMLIDGKASNNLAFTVTAMLRDYGQEANLRVINMMVSGGDKKTNTWNPFAAINAEGMTELLLTLFLPEEGKDGGSGSQHFEKRADSLIRGMAYVLVWVRDEMTPGIPVTSETIRLMVSEIANLRTLVEDRLFTYYDFATDTAQQRELPANFPTALLSPVRNYLSETGGFTKSKSLDEQDKVREQHSYVVGGFAKAFTQMGSTLGHVFRCAVPDIDLRDILFNRRILVVLLPSLENHPDTNMALGKTVITALRYALAAALGTSIEGNYQDLVVNRPSASRTPYPVVLDEFNYFAVRGMDMMIAQGRELNISVLLSFQEVSSLYATLGRDRCGPLLGNPKLKIFGNIEDSGATKEWVEGTGGEMPVSVLPGYETSAALGVYADQQRADIRNIKRISWNDIQNLRRGQTIILFRGKRIYATVFHLGLKPDGENRVFPTLAQGLHTMPTAVEPAVTSTTNILARLKRGADLVQPQDMQPLAEPLGALYDRMARIINLDLTPLDDAAALLDDGETVSEASEDDTSDMPFAWLFRNIPTPTPSRPVANSVLDPSIDPALCDRLVAFEVGLGTSEAEARNFVVGALNRTASLPQPIT